MVEESSEDPRLSKEPESGSPGFWEGYPSVVRLLFRPAGARSFSHLPTHGLRPFDKLRASCGLHSYAASRLRVRSFTSPRLRKSISHANATRSFAGESKGRSEVRENQEQIKGRGRGRPRHRCCGGGPERSDVVGFTGTGYQRSLRVHESDEYNF